jgi:mono/diheme cytochrome c family protein
MATGIKKLFFVSLLLGLGLLPFAALGEPSGEELYFETCAVCHGGDGAGTMPGIPDMSGASGPLWKSDKDLITTIINGVERSDLPTPMPAKGGNDDLTPEKVRSVLEFMRREFGN